MKQMIIMLFLVVLTVLTVNANGNGNVGDTIKITAQVHQITSDGDTTYEVPVQLIGFDSEKDDSMKVAKTEPELEIDTAEVMGIINVMDWLENVLQKPTKDLYSFYEPTLHKRVSMLQRQTGAYKYLEIMFWDNNLNPIQYIDARMDTSSSTVFIAALTDNLALASWPNPQDFGNIIPDSLVQERAKDFTLLKFLAACDCKDEK